MSLEKDRSTLLLFEALAEQIQADERFPAGVRDTYTSLLALMAATYVEALGRLGVDVDSIVGQAPAKEAN